MSKALITESSLTAIANAIRAKNGSSDTYTPPQMAVAIEAIPTGGITPTGTKQITQNGTHDVTQYANANVLVQPNLQSKTATENGTVTADQGYDGLSSVVVNVSGGGSDGVYVGTDDPSSSEGENGDYYYKRRLIWGYGYSKTPDSGSSTTQTGYEFTANSNITVVGLRAYRRSSYPGGSILLATSSGEIIARVDNVSFSQGWTEVMLDTPVQLTAGSNYIVQAIAGASGFNYAPASNLGFNSAITFVRGRYGGLPGSADSSNAYSADIIIRVSDSIYKVVDEYYKQAGGWVKI